MQTQEKPRLSGMIGFTVVWIGQIVSVLASGMTSFAMTIYMYQQTHSATAMGFVQVAYITPLLIMSPIAGVMVDRYNRKLMMMVSDIAGGIATLSLFILYATGHLQYWHIYIAVAVSGIGTTFQWPAYSAAISTMVSKEQYGRANGMMSLIEAGPGVLSPFLAGALIPIIQIGGILLIELDHILDGHLCAGTGLRSAAAAHFGRRSIQRRFLEGSRVRFQIYFCASQSARLANGFLLWQSILGNRFYCFSADAFGAHESKYDHPRLSQISGVHWHGDWWHRDECLGRIQKANAWCFVWLDCRCIVRQYYFQLGTQLAHLGACRFIRRAFQSACQRFKSSDLAGEGRARFARTRFSVFWPED